MTTEIAEKLLWEYLFDGLASEVFYAQQAKLLSDEIGKRSEKINRNGYGYFFGHLQTAYSERQTLCIAKMFDRPNKNFRVRSIPTILDLIENHASTWVLKNREQLETSLIRRGQVPSLVRQVDSTSLCVLFAQTYRARLPTTGGTDSLSVGLRKIRESRDKAIAHNEAIEREARNHPTWGEAGRLVDFAEAFLVIVGECFLGLSMTDDEGQRLYIGDSPEYLTNSLESVLDSMDLSV